MNGEGPEDLSEEVALLRAAVAAQTTEIQWLRSKLHSLETAVAIAATAFHEVTPSEVEEPDEGDGAS